MRATNSLARWGLAACVIGSMGLLQAQEAGLSKDFKLRLGYNPNALDHLRESSLGFGLNLGYTVPAVGTFGVEAGYYYNSGDPFGGHSDGSMVPAGKNPLNPYNPLQPDQVKRNEFAGLTVRLSYQKAINEDFRFQAGLQLGGKYKHQYTIDAMSTSWGYNATTGWRDNIFGVASKADLNPSPYVGLTYNLDKDSSLEFNVMLLNYKSLNYHHYAGTASAYEYAGSDWPEVGNFSVRDATFAHDKVEETRRSMPHLEIAYVFHF